MVPHGRIICIPLPTDISVKEHMVAGGWRSSTACNGEAGQDRSMTLLGLQYDLISHLKLLLQSFPTSTVPYLLKVFSLEGLLVEFTRT